MEENGKDEISLEVYVAKFFENLKRDIDLYVEGVLAQKADKKLPNSENELNRELVINFIKDQESEALKKCTENKERLEANLNQIIHERKELEANKPTQENSDIYNQKLTGIKNLSLEFKREIFNDNLFFIEWVNPKNDLNKRNASLIVLKPICLDDFQVQLLR